MILHFVLTSEWKYQFHLAVVSAAITQRPERIMLWTIYDMPGGPIWDETVKFMSGAFVAFDVQKYNFEGEVPNIPVLKKELSQLDVLRAYGGLFLDLDTISLRQIEMDRTKEAYAPPENIWNRRFNVAVLGCPAGSPLIEEMYQIALKQANNGVPYVWGDLGPKLATDMFLTCPERLHIPPCGEAGLFDAWDMWGTSPLPPEGKVFHLFNACQPEFANITGPHYIEAVDNNYTRVVRQVIPEPVWRMATGASPFKQIGNCDHFTLHRAYLDVYARLFEPLRESGLPVLEIGTAGAHGLLMYAEYFKQSNIAGFDPDCPKPELKGYYARVKHYGIDAYCAIALGIAQGYGGFGVIIDDGPHTLESQCWFAANYPQLLHDKGLAVIEDIQNIAHIPELVGHIPEGFEHEVFDLREVNGRFDDILLCIRR